VAEMIRLKSLSREEGLALTKKRTGEIRVGERAHYIDARKSLSKNLASTSAKFILLGLPEDVAFAQTLAAAEHIQHGNRHWKIS
jgi:formiminoglutamase